MSRRTPIYAYFDVDERTNLEFRRMMEAGKVKSARDVHVPVWLGLVDEEGYPLEGTINFVDNRLDPMTGTLQLRGLFKNPKGLLAPGMFARIRVPVGTPHRAILVPEGALGSDQGKRFLYVVGKDNKVEYRPVTVGALRDGLRVIDQGLSRRGGVVVGGLQAIRPKMVVRVKEAETAAQGRPWPLPAASRRGPTRRRPAGRRKPRNRKRRPGHWAPLPACPAVPTARLGKPTEAPIHPRRHRRPFPPLHPLRVLPAILRRSADVLAILH